MTGDKMLAERQERVRYWYEVVMKQKPAKATWVYQKVAEKCQCSWRTVFKYIKQFESQN